MELTHWLTRVKVVPDAVAAINVPEAERKRGADLAQRLSMPVLARCWQMLMKGLGEARVAPNPLSAVEMVLVRLAYVADLPAPAELVKALAKGGAAPSPPAAAPGSTGDGGQRGMAATAPRRANRDRAGPAARRAAAPVSLADVIALAEARGEMRLAVHLRNDIRLVHFRDPAASSSNRHPRRRQSWQTRWVRI